MDASKSPLCRLHRLGVFVSSHLLGYFDLPTCLLPTNEMLLVKGKSTHLLYSTFQFQNDSVVVAVVEILSSLCFTATAFHDQFTSAPDIVPSIAQGMSINHAHQPCLLSISINFLCCFKSRLGCSRSTKPSCSVTSCVAGEMKGAVSDLVIERGFEEEESDIMFEAPDPPAFLENSPTGNGMDSPPYSTGMKTEVTDVEEEEYNSESVANNIIRKFSGIINQPGVPPLGSIVNDMEVDKLCLALVDDHILRIPQRHSTTLEHEQESLDHLRESLTRTRTGSNDSKVQEDVELSGETAEDNGEQSKKVLTREYNEEEIFCEPVRIEHILFNKSEDLVLPTSDDLERISRGVFIDEFIVPHLDSLKALLEVSTAPMVIKLEKRRCRATRIRVGSSNTTTGGNVSQEGEPDNVTDDVRVCSRDSPTEQQNVQQNEQQMEEDTGQSGSQSIIVECHPSSSSHIEANSSEEEEAMDTAESAKIVSNQTTLNLSSDNPIQSVSPTSPFFDSERVVNEPYSDSCQPSDKEMQICSNEGNSLDDSKDITGGIRDPSNTDKHLNHDLILDSLSDSGTLYDGDR